MLVRAARAQRRRLATAVSSYGDKAEVVNGMLVVDMKRVTASPPFRAPPVWVRDNDWSTASRDAETLERKVPAWEQPEQLSFDGGDGRVTWRSRAAVGERLAWRELLSPAEPVLCVSVGGQEAFLPRVFLSRWAVVPRSVYRTRFDASDMDDRALRVRDPGVRTWDKYAFSKALPWRAFDSVASSQPSLASFLGSFRMLGFGLLHSAPSIQDVLTLLGGIVREALPFDPIFDIKMVNDPKAWNHTFDAHRLAPRTNNPYRNPEPTVQVVHCLTPAPLGGETLLADGLKVADVLRGRDPAGFAALAAYEAIYSLSKPGEAYLEDRGPVIVVDGSSKRVKSIRFNPRSLETFDAPYDALRDCYRGLKTFSDICNELAISFKLGTHDAVVVDNTRILHGREGFRNAETAARALQGAFVDLDAIQAKHRRLAARAQTPQ